MSAVPGYVWSIVIVVALFAVLGVTANRQKARRPQGEGQVAKPFGAAFPHVPEAPPDQTAIIEIKRPTADVLGLSGYVIVLGLFLAVLGYVARGDLGQAARLRIGSWSVVIGNADVAMLVGIVAVASGVVIAMAQRRWRLVATAQGMELSPGRGATRYLGYSEITKVSYKLYSRGISLVVFGPGKLMFANVDGKWAGTDALAGRLRVMRPDLFPQPSDPPPGAPQA